MEQGGAVTSQDRRTVWVASGSLHPIAHPEHAHPKTRVFGVLCTQRRARTKEAASMVLTSEQAACSARHAVIMHLS